MTDTTSPRDSLLRVGTWNLHDYGRRGGAEESERRAQVHAVIRELDVDILAVQEVCGHGPRTLERLAEAVGMACHYQPPILTEDGGEPGRVALAAGGGQPAATFHVGLLWQGRVVPDPASWRVQDRGMWHAAAFLDVLVDGQHRLTVGSYHGPPHSPHARVDEATRIVHALTGSTAPGIVGGDWNAVPADRIDGAYHHPEPYTGHAWRGELVQQCHWELDPITGAPARWWADRRPGEVLLAAGLRDTAALAGRPWRPSTGHHAQDLMPPRAIDTHRVTPGLAPAVLDHAVVDSDRARLASDHLPVVTTMQLSRRE